MQKMRLLQIYRNYKKNYLKIVNKIKTIYFHLTMLL